MWIPPTWLIGAAASGLGNNAARSAVPLLLGQTTREVRCENCRRRYAYELTQTAVNEEGLRRKLAEAVEAIPCPACGWYQSDMIPLARKRHYRWKLNAGLCLTIGLIPVAAISTSLNLTYGGGGAAPPIPWPIFAAGAAGLACLLAAGIALLWQYNMGQGYDPNSEDVEARRQYGQSRATLLSGPAPDAHR
jgi:hypothetical protein